MLAARAASQDRRVWRGQRGGSAPGVAASVARKAPAEPRRRDTPAKTAPELRRMHMGGQRARPFPPVCLASRALRLQARWTLAGGAPCGRRAHPKWQQPARRRRRRRRQRQHCHAARPQSSCPSCPAATPPARPAHPRPGALPERAGGWGPGGAARRGGRGAGGDGARRPAGRRLRRRRRVCAARDRRQALQAAAAKGGHATHPAQGIRGVHGHQRRRCAAADRPAVPHGGASPISVHAGSMCAKVSQALCTMVVHAGWRREQKA